MNFNKKHIILIIVLFTIYSYTQTLNINNYDSIMNNINISNKEKLIKVEKLLNNNAFVVSDKANVYFKFSKWNWGKKNRDEKRAKAYANKASTLFFKEKKLELYKRNLFNLSFFNRRSKFPNYINALKNLDALIKVANPNEIRLGKAYGEKGLIYDLSGDFQRALENYEKSELIFKKQSNNNELLKIYINIAAMYADLNDSTYLKPFLENAEKINIIKKETFINKSSQIKLLLNTGAIYNTTKGFEKSVDSYNDALKLAKEKNDSVLVAWVLNNLGVYYKKKKNFIKAKQLYKEAKNYANTNRTLKSSYFNNIADLFLLKNDYNSALTNYNKAIATLLISDIENNESITNLPNLEAIKISPYTKDILEYLIDKTFAWRKYYNTTLNKKYLLQEEKTIVLIDEIIDLLYFESREDLSKLFWREKGANLYVEAVSVCYLLNKPEKAIYFMEKNKGLLLLENISNTDAKLYAKIPEPLLEKEDTYIQTIKSLKDSLLNFKLSLNKKDKLKNSLLNSKFKYEKFIDSLEFQFPQYQKFKNKITITSSNKIQENLEEDELSVEYILGKEAAYVMLIAKDNLQFKKIDSVADLRNKIHLFKEKITKPFATNEEIINYQKIANSLFKQLFPFKNIEELLENKKLSIISDGVLQEIPFEALITTNDKEYLINKCGVYYKYSFSLNSKIKINDHTKNRISVFSNTKFKDDYLPTFDNNKEIKPSFFDFNRKPHITKEATKEQFINLYNNNSILHISTHGGLDLEMPWLAFYDEKLFLNELYFLKSPKKLVVLNACKTSVGKNQKGEGQQSLTKGFINAGARSVLSSLWNINEKSSKEITTYFRKQLRANKNKSIALRNAKLSYLKKYKNTSQSSPYYWSPIILTGSDEPIYKQDYLLYYVSLGLILFLIIFYKVYKK